ncbi:MAG TPA: putative Ig domain-containing protein [Anaerolineaceae bacterium]|nr:putative Ig domain-containing protein [Anaerolineaceae bacterium]
MKTKWNLLMLFALLLGMMVITPKQTVSAAVGAATFYFTSSANPSRQYQAVTFTVSATGTDPTYPPFGIVSFYDNGEAILCQGEAYHYYQAKLNADENFNPVAGVPAVCTTTELDPGFHTITAVFYSHWPEAYPDESLTLADGQTINPPVPLTISPETLPNGVYGNGYLQALTAVSDDGYSCGSNCFWFVEGSTPAGLYIYSSTGLIEGNLEQPGDFTFTVTAINTTDGYEGSRTYTIAVSKATPVVTIHTTGFTSEDDLYLEASVTHPDNSYTIPSGWVSFSIDGIPLEACSGENVKPVGMWGSAACIAPPPAGMVPGTHSLRADFIPGEAGYNSASAEEPMILPARIDGLLFADLDRDGIRDPETEMPVYNSWKVDLDQDCDGLVDHWTYTEYDTGQFSIVNLPPDTYCLVIPAPGNWRQTTSLGAITLDEDQYFEIGFYNVELAANPRMIPDGSIGVAYNQSISISGGEAPYSMIYSDVYLPAGLTFDEATLTISGTPTSVGYAELFFRIQDAGGAAGYFEYYFEIKADASITLNSDANPSTPGQAVTFTLTGSGDLVDSNNVAIAPYGYVTFYDGDSVIAGCEDVVLNYDSDLGTVDLPAVCTTSALTDGLHEIKADFYSIGYYHSEVVTLTQQVGPLDTTIPVFLPIIMGDQGENDWYTGDVSLSWSVTDDESEIQSKNGCEPVTITSDQAATAYTCTATSAGGSGSGTVTIQRDATPPAVVVTGVTAGATYALGSAPLASCATADTLSGVASEAALTLNGGDAHGVGDITATCAGGTDNAGNASDPVSLKYTVSLPPASANLELTKVDRSDPVNVGSSLLYTLTVSNRGPDAAENVVLTDTFDLNTSYVKVSNVKGWTCKQTDGVLTCSTKSLASGATATFNLAVMVSRSAAPGSELVNTAWVSSPTYDPDLENNATVQATLVKAKGKKKA